MECGICLNDCILEKDMHYTECLHCFCFQCFTQLLTDSCPFCRQTIILPYRPNRRLIVNNTVVEELDIDSDIIFEDDFIIPTMRINRHEYHRNKVNRRRERLNTLLNADTAMVSIFPNNKLRISRKIRSI